MYNWENIAATLKKQDFRCILKNQSSKEFRKKSLEKLVMESVLSIHIPDAFPSFPKLLEPLFCRTPLMYTYTYKCTESHLGPWQTSMKKLFSEK